MAQDRRHRQNGAFTVTAVLNDTLAGLAQVTFPETVSPEATYPQEGAHQATVSHVYAFDADDDFSDDATVQATDRAGNEGQARFWVTRDAVSPEVSLDAQVQGRDVRVTWGARDTGSDLQTCELAVRDGEDEWEPLSANCAGAYIHSGEPGHLYTFHFTATDNVGNEAAAEVQAGIPRVTKYYYHGGQRVAMRVDEEGGDEVYYLHSDHLGSTSLVTLGEARHVGGGVVLPAGSEWSRQWYYPYGEPRATSGNTNPTDRTFNGQLDVGLGLMHYGARFYDPFLGRFISADTVVPNPGNPQDLNRYSYVRNSPLNFTDPSGHAICVDQECNQVVHPVSGEIIWRGPIPPVIAYIRGEMVANAQGGIVELLQSLNQACYSCAWANVPDWMPGVGEGRRNAAIADTAAKAEAFAIFGYMVRQKGPWDPKPHIGEEYDFSQRIGDAWYYYDIWGNIMFGYLGTAAGFSESELLEGAGLEQIGSSMGYAIRKRDSSYLPRREPGVSGLRAWDDPVDRVTTQIGTNLWNAYSLDVTPMDIIQAIGAEPRIPTRDEPW